jgi:acetyl-CoA C-acetyltransferase
MAEVVIVGAARTPIGRSFTGSMADVRSDDMGGFVVAQILRQLPQVEPWLVQDLYWGCALPHHSQGYNMARQVGLIGGLPDTVPAATMSRACGSSLTAVRAAAHAIQADDGEIYLAGGSESDSMCMGRGFDEIDRNPRFTDENSVDFINRAYMDVFTTAERVADLHHVSRIAMDEFAVLSQQRVAAAISDGFYAREISAYTTPSGALVSLDECPRPDTTVERLAALRPIVPDAGGRVTAGNTTVAGDGAAAVMLMSAERAAQLEVIPLARIVATAMSGLDPELMGLGSIEATRKALARAAMKVRDLDIVECHENFSSQVIPICEELDIDVDRQLNPFGGSLALGHPSGMTGARILVTLLNGLARRDETLGAATTCTAGGQGATVIVERLA